MINTEAGHTLDHELMAAGFDTDCWKVVVMCELLTQDTATHTPLSSPQRLLSKHAVPTCAATYLRELSLSSCRERAMTTGLLT